MTWVQTGSTIIFKPYSLEDALRGLAEAGFENVEIGAVKGFLEHLDPDRLGEAEVDGCRRLLDRYGLTVVSMSGHAQLHTEEGRQRLGHVLRAGQKLGISVLNTFTGDASTAVEVAAFRESVRALADEAEAAGIRLCIETDSNMLPTAEIGIRILEEIGHPAIRFNYDPGNVVYYTGAVPEMDIGFALPRLGHVHLKDQRGGKGVADFPPLGEGDVDIPSIVASLRSIDFSGPVSMEIEFANYEWPSWDECVGAAKRGKAYWDGLT
jgi:sugar phosphate isomerase/epimerase